MQALIFIGILFLAFGGLAYGVIRQKKRREAWQAVAAELGFTYYEEAISRVRDECPGFDLFQQGGAQRVRNVIQGENGGIRVTLGDYSYTTGSGKNTSSHFHSVCVLRTAALSLPHFQIRPQISVKMLAFFQTMLGGKDINFDEDPEFSDALVLQGEDESAVRASFVLAVRRACLPLKEKGLRAEGWGPSLLLYHTSRVQPQEAKDMVALAFALMNAFGEKKA